MYLVHWPFPNFHPPECDVSSRSPDARPYIHENFMKTWRQMEKLVELGLVRHIGTSNVTIPKLTLILRDARIKPAVNEMELHPHFQQPELFEFVRGQRHPADRVQPDRIAGPAGARSHAGRYGRHRRPGDRRHRGAAGGASGGGLRQVGGAARRDADSVLHQAAQLSGEPAGRGFRPADGGGDAVDREHRPQLPADQGPGVFVETGPDVGRSLGPGRSRSNNDWRIPAGQQHRGDERSAGPGSRTRRSPAAHEGLDHLRVGHPLHLSRAPGQGAGRLPGRDRRPRAVRADRQGGAGLPPLRRRRPGDRVPHLGLRGVQRLPPRLHDLVHQRAVPARVRLAARWRDGGVPAGRGEGPDPPARRTQLRRWRAGGVRIRHGLRGAARRSGSAATTRC